LHQNPKDLGGESLIAQLDSAVSQAEQLRDQQVQQEYNDRLGIYVQEKAELIDRLQSNLAAALTSEKAQLQAIRQSPPGWTADKKAHVASEQAKATQFEREKSELLTQIADLQRILSDEKARASKLEGHLEMMETQVIPQFAEVRQSLNRALEDAMTARQEAKEERANRAAEQAKVAELLIQIADLQRVLGDEKGGMRRGAARYVRNSSTRIQTNR
jgi:hypothetical protein